MAITTFVGQNYGAKKFERIKKGMGIAVGLGIIYTLVIGAVMLAFSHQVMSLFTDDESVIAMGQLAMWYFCLFYWVISILNIMAGAVRGTGCSVPPMIVLILSLCVFRFIWIQCALPQFTSIEGLFVLYPISWAVGTVLMVFYTWRGSWLRQQAAK